MNSVCSKDSSITICQILSGMRFTLSLCKYTFLLIIITKTPNLIGAQVVHFCLTTYTLAFGSVAFCIPKGFRNGLLSTELRHSTVDCHSFHDGDNTVFLLAAVHVEQHFECTSCHTRFLFTKLNINELDIDTQTGDKRCNSIYHMLNLTLSRVMIYKPSFFLNLLFLRIPIFRLVII